MSVQIYYIRGNKKDNKPVITTGKWYISSGCLYIEIITKSNWLGIATEFAEEYYFFEVFDCED